jgi:hypothetical protein
MSNYTDSLGLEEITPGDQSGLWGTTTNNNLALIDQAVTGVTPITEFNGVSGTTKTLTDFNGAADESRAAVLNITGTATGSNTVVIPNKQKTYLVRNNTGQNVVFQTASPNATYSVLSGNSILIFCDGDNNVYTGIQSPSTGTLTVPGGGTGVTTFGAGGIIRSSGGTANLFSYPTVSLTAEVAGTLPVANGGTGASTLTANALLLGNGTSAISSSLVGLAAGQVATWNGTTWYSGTGVSLSGSNAWTGSNSFSVTPTVSGSNVLTTATGAQLSGASFTGLVTTSNAVSSTSGGGYSALQSNAVGIGTSSNTISSTGAGSVFNFNVGGSIAAALSASQFVPVPSGTLSLGSGGLFWTTVYATNGTINTSDGTQKQQIAELTTAEIAVAKILKGLIRTFKFNDSVAEKGSNARIHTGVIAQDVYAAFAAQGLDAAKYGLFCSDTWYEVDGKVLDEDGNKYTASAIGAVSVTRLGIRYDELLAFIIAGL